MTSQPVLESERLTLRPFDATDAPWVLEYAGTREVARNTQNIPHPYEPGMAEAWISKHGPGWDDGQLAVFAITRRSDQAPLGAIGLTIDRDNGTAELGYWIGPPWSGRGYATEAAASIVAFGFTRLGLHRVMARHFGSNPASGRVMQKIGMICEGRLREHYLKWDQREDIIIYATLAAEWNR